MRVRGRWMIVCAAAVIAGLGLLAVGMAGADAEATAIINGDISDAVGPVDGVAVDLYSAAADGSRSTWLETQVAESGSYLFDVSPGCYVVTFIAPQGRRFVEGGQWRNVGVCVDDFEVEWVNAQLWRSVGAVASGQVTAADGSPVDGVLVDLFAATGLGSRGTWLRAARTGSDGTAGAFRFDVPAGCYVLTFVAPDDQVFDRSGTAWRDQRFCLDLAEQNTELNAVLLPIPGGGITASVERSGQPVEGVSVDLFTADATGGRATFVTSSATAEDGTVTFPADSGCYVLTYVAPPRGIWERSQSGWLNVGICVADSATAQAEPAVLEALPGPAIILDVLIEKEGSIVPRVQVDVFEADAAGGRGRFVDSGMTLSRFRTQFSLQPGFGCWAITFVAPGSDVFVETGTKWLNRSFCTTPDQTWYPFEAQLAPPPSSGLAVDLRQGLVKVEGVATTEAAIDYQLSGTPGALAGIELLGPNFMTCGPNAPLLLVVKAGDTIIEPSSSAGCSSFGPWQLPPDGRLTLSIRGADGMVAFSAVMAEVQYREVAVDLTSDTAQVSGRLTVPNDGIDYLVNGEPGHYVTLELGGPTCARPLSLLSAQVLDPGGEQLGADVRRCTPAGPWEIPASGSLTVRVLHNNGGFFLEQERHGFELTMSTFAIEGVVVPAGQPSVELDGAVTAPFDRTDYYLDATSFDAYTIQIIDPDGVEHCQESGIQFFADVFHDESYFGRTEICELQRQRDTSEATTVRIRLSATVPSSPDGPYTGSYQVRINQLSYGEVPLDLNTGPVTVDGSIAQPYDRIEYVISAPPGSWVSAIEPGVEDQGALCGDIGLLRLGFEVIDPVPGDRTFSHDQTCGRNGPWQVSTDGTLRLRAFDEQGSGSTGSFTRMFKAFTIEERTVNLGTNPIEVSETLEAAFDGTDYLVVGQPGDLFKISVSHLHFVDGCDNFRRLSVQLELFDQNGDLFDFADLGYDGCLDYGPWQIGADGSLLVRLSASGSGTDYEGDYTMSFVKVGGL